MAAQRHRYPEDFLKELESEIGDIEGTVIGVEKQMKNYNEKEIRDNYRKLTKLLIEKKLTITTMESATSGQIASLITDTEGSSAILKGAFITYSNEAKIMQGVPQEVLEKFSVYSIETAIEMAKACRKTYRANIGIALLQKFTGQGIGRLMLNVMLDEIKKLGFEQAELIVIDHNDRAKHLYESLGFKECGRYPNANKYDDGTYADDILMVKNF